jgi:hypothetical protein
MVSVLQAVGAPVRLTAQDLQTHLVLTLTLLQPPPTVAAASTEVDLLPAQLEAIINPPDTTPSDGSFNFKDIPPDRPTLEVPLKPDHTPVYDAQYPIPIAYLPEAKKQVLQWLSEGKIERTGPGQWNTAFFPKVEASKIRLCFNFQPLNGECDPVNYPLPDIPALLDKVASNKFYTVLDLSSGYHQIAVDPSQRHLLAFSHPELGRFAWKVLPFGLGCAPPFFHHYVSSIFRPLIDAGVVSVYIDDIIIHTLTASEHIDVCRKVMDKLRELKLVVKPTKVQLGQTKVRFLGHLVSHGAIEVLPEHTLQLKDFPTPNTGRQMERFLGAAQWVARFCPALGDTTGPLHAATTQRKIKWTPELRDAYDHAKRILLDPATLVPYDPAAPLTLQVDASDHGWGAALLQPSGVAAYTGGTFKGHETSWHVREKELAAALKALRTWTPYTAGRPVNVVTDHKPNTAIKLKKKVNYHKIIRWLEEMNEYDLRWMYIPGKDNPFSDWLSRLHDNNKQLSR